MRMVTVIVMAVKMSMVTRPKGDDQEGCRRVPKKDKDDVGSRSSFASMLSSIICIISEDANAYPRPSQSPRKGATGSVHRHVHPPAAIPNPPHQLHPPNKGEGRLTTLNIGLISPSTSSASSQLRILGNIVPLLPIPAPCATAIPIGCPYGLVGTLPWAWGCGTEWLGDAEARLAWAMNSLASWDSREGLETDMSREGKGLKDEREGARRVIKGSGEWFFSWQSWRVPLRGPGLRYTSACTKLVGGGLTRCRQSQW